MNLSERVRELKNIFLFYLSRKLNIVLIPPKTMQISVTYRCNLKCKMCMIHYESQKIKNEPLKEEFFKLIDEADKFKIKELVLTGGEPFLREDIFDIIKYAKTKLLKVIVTTNATLINKELAEKIIKSGLDHLHISIDGLKKSNDFFRGNGAFKKIIKSVDYLNYYKRRFGKGPSLGFACVVMDKNVNELLNLYKLADTLKIDVINFSPLVSDNRDMAIKGNTQFWIPKYKLDILKEQLRAIKEFKPKHTFLYENPGLDLFNKYYEGIITDSDWKCFNGLRTVILPICIKGGYNDFEINICKILCGSLKNKSLKECWNSKEAYEARKIVKKCKNLCLQSCFSMPESESFRNLFKKCLRSFKNG